MHRSPRSLAYNLDILSQLPDGLFAAKPCGALAYNLDILSQLPDGLFAAKPCGALTDYMWSPPAATKNDHEID
jgi:hypothetical protein